jgi:hypothetical protein
VLAPDVAAGDADVEGEIVMSTARLVGGVQKVLSIRSTTSTRMPEKAKQRMQCLPHEAITPKVSSHFIKYVSVSQCMS